MFWIWLLIAFNAGFAAGWWAKNHFKGDMQKMMAKIDGKIE